MRLKLKLTLPKRLFWDTNLTNTTLDNFPQFVIVRVFERGEIEDIKSIRNYYGDKLIKDEIVKAIYI